MSIPRLAACLAALLVSFSAFAHHGWSSYDAKRIMTVDVPLVAVSYRNPHADVEVDYQGKRWHVVLAPISRLQARGLPEQALKVGKTVRIVGYPRADGTAEIRAERITVDGKTIELR